ncbi:meiosis mei2 [Fusarium longipes]|uniref:Meiosis mei2 n=1 Tax=Fusarium longipes TaxID=694270 RepID=A0A395S654_9HYPO|nr:meiosis mei2 [Fusarium longipes]
MATRRETGHRNMSSPPEGALMDSSQGTPDTRLTVFSPGASSVTYHNGGYGGGSYSTGPVPSYNAYAPQGSITGDRVVSRFERDPFVDNSTSGRLSPTASTFQPRSERNKGKAAAILLPSGGMTVANTLSHEMDISHRLELCDTPSPGVDDVQAFLESAHDGGSRFFGARHVETDGSHVYVCFEDLRDSIFTFNAVRKSDKTWLPSYVKVKKERLDRGDVRLAELRQLDVVIEILNSAIVDPSHVDEIVQQALSAFGSLFALVRIISNPSGGFRGVVQFCKAAKATWAFQTIRSWHVAGLGIHLLRPEDAFQGVDGLVANMDSLSFSSYGGHFGYQASNVNVLAPRAPEGNPWAPVAYQFSAGPTYRPFYGPQTPGNAMVRSRGPGYGGPYAVNNMTLNHRRAPRMGRGPVRGINNVVDLYDLMAGRDVRTTIMLRNIPNKVDQPLLKRIVDYSSHGKYDFMYLRIDFANDCNVGYAFINFVKAEYIVDFVQARANKRWNCFRSDKVAEVSYATIQGKDCLVQKFRNSSVMLEAEHYRPKLFYTVHCGDPSLVGQEEPFPGPDNQSKMKRSVENAEHVGLFTPTAGQHFREAQRHRHSQFDRGTRLAALEEATYEQSLIRHHGRY